MTNITVNKKASFNYSVEETFEAGLILHGWEVKSVRAGKVQITDGYVHIKDGTLNMIGCIITPLLQASTHHEVDAQRTKTLLMKKAEIRRLIGKVEQKGYTLVAMDLHWNHGKVKCKVGLAKGKTTFDKRETVKDRDTQRIIERAMKNNRC